MLRQFLERGWLGEVFEVHGVMSKVVEPNDRNRLASFSGGMMFELGCHLIDLIVAMLGRPEEVTPFLQHASKLDDRLTDNTLAVLRYPKALASVKSSALEVDGFARRHMVVCGTEGTFHIQPLDSPKAIVSLAKPRGPITTNQQVISFPPYRRYIDDAIDFARMIRGEKPADFSPRQDRDVQETVLRASGMPLDV
jgi:predicted dehydrogenase